MTKLKEINSRECLNGPVEVLMLGHGSRRREANESFLAVADRVMQMIGQKVTPAFMSNGEPNLSQAVQALIDNGAKTIVIMPLFLFRGIHVTVDIHEELEPIQLTHPEVNVIFTEELASDDGIAKLAGTRVLEVLKR